MIGPYLAGTAHLYAGSGGLSIRQSHGMSSCFGDIKAQNIVMKISDDYEVGKFHPQEAERAQVSGELTHFLRPSLCQGTMSWYRKNGWKELFSEDVMVVCETDKWLNRRNCPFASGRKRRESGVTVCADDYYHRPNGSKWQMGIWWTASDS